MVTTGFDLFAEWQVSRESKLKLAMENLLDDDFEETIGFSNPGYQVTVTFVASLGL